MQITKISYSKTIESQIMGAGVWIKVGVEADVKDEIDVPKAIQQAKLVVDDAHQKELAGRTGDIYFNVTTQKEER